MSSGVVKYSIKNLLIVYGIKNICHGAVWANVLLETKVNSFEKFGHGAVWPIML